MLSTPTRPLSDRTRKKSTDERRTSMAPDNIRAGAVDLESATIPEVARGLDPMPAAPRHRLVLRRAWRVRGRYLRHAQYAQS